MGPDGKAIVLLGSGTCSRRFFAAIRCWSASDARRRANTIAAAARSTSATSAVAAMGGGGGSWAAATGADCDGCAGEDCSDCRAARSGEGAAEGATLGAPFVLCNTSA